MKSSQLESEFNALSMCVVGVYSSRSRSWALTLFTCAHMSVSGIFAHAHMSADDAHAHAHEWMSENLPAHAHERSYERERHNLNH
jgi:hypothetical protein